MEELAARQEKLIERLRGIVDQSNGSMTHSATCWEWHDACAIHEAILLLEGWEPLCCAEHNVYFLAPECPECA